MVVGGVTLLISIIANIIGASILLAGGTYLAGAFALVLSPLPVASALILGISEGNWVILFFNLPVVVFALTLPLTTYIMDHLRVLNPLPQEAQAENA